MALESTRPLSFMGSQVLAFAGPMLKLAFAPAELRPPAGIAGEAAQHRLDHRGPSPTGKTGTVDKLDVIIATDCGSTTTKAILIERLEEGYRQTFRGARPRPR